jgi:aspartate racemase
MKRIGILGGSSDQATADDYRRLNGEVNKRLGGSHTAELLINSMDFAFSSDCVRNERWNDLDAYLAERATALERAGAQLLLCVSNTMHRTTPVFTAGLSIPFLHIVDPTAMAILAKGLHRVALVGTKPVMSTDFLIRRYADNFGIEAFVPDSDEQDEVDRIIFEELCRGRFTASSKSAYLAILDRMQERGAQGAKLGYTEIPRLMNQPDRPDFPMFDTTGLHASAAVDMALGAEQASSGAAGVR